MHTVQLLAIIPSSAATTRRDFRRRRDFFASMGTVFEHGKGLKSRLVVADEDGIKRVLNVVGPSVSEDIVKIGQFIVKDLRYWYL